jgi:protein-disulfide isomerase
MRLALLLSSALALTTALALTAQTPDQKAAPKTQAKAAVKTSAAPAKNFKLIGKPTATVTVEIYTDYQCPHCARLYLETMPEINAKYVATGKIQVLHRDFPLINHQYAKLAARYANAAGQIGKYELVVNQIFTAQAEWSQNGNVDAAVAKVLPAADMAKVREAVKSDEHLEDSLKADVAQGLKDNLTETPTMMIVKAGKREKISGFMPANILASYLDQKLAGK